MPVHTVIFVTVVGREIEAPAKPPDRFLPFALCHKQAHIGMRRRGVRITRMDYQRHPECLRTAASQLRAMYRGRRRHLRNMHMRKQYAAFLDHGAIFQNTGATSAALGTSPFIRTKAGTAFFCFQHGADTILQIEQICFYGGNIRCRWSCRCRHKNLSVFLKRCRYGHHEFQTACHLPPVGLAGCNPAHRQTAALIPRHHKQEDGH